MTEQNQWLQVKALLKKLPFLSEQDVQDLPKTKNALWMKLSKFIRNSISYHFDEDVQFTSNKIFDQLNTLLGTKKATDIKQKGKKKLEQFSEIIMRIINQLEEQLVKLQQQDPDMQQVQEKALANVFGRIIPRWTCTELNELIERKLKRYQNNPNLTVEQKKQRIALENFQERIADMEIDVEIVDRLIVNRIGQNPNDTLNQSNISQVARSYQTLDSNEDSQIKDVQQALETMNLGRQTKSEVKVIEKEKKIVPDHKKEEIKGVFVKKEYRFLDQLEEKPKSEPPKVQIKVQKKQQEPKPSNKMNLNELPVFSTERGNSQKQQEKIPENKSNSNQSQSSHSNVDVSFTQINDSIFESEDRKQNQQYSQQLIERFASQSRFTKGIYENRRDVEVREIEQNQIQPLLVHLKGLTGRHLDKFSQSFEPVIVQMYGSYENKAGFRKTSDININLTIKGIQQRNMHSTMFGLRNLLDNYRKRGMLNSLNLRSVIYSQQHQQVILSHENNRTKRRQPNAVNFIYLTINRNDYVLSSKFMKQVVYSGKDKATDIANLTNLLHLLFKGNCILDHKDIYHVWWTQTPNDRAKKKQSQSRYVSISIYAMHMMILYYLQEEGIISQITYSNESKSYDFELLKPNITLFEMLGGFLRFYSSQGNYIKDHVGSVVDVIDDRPREKDQKIRKLVKDKASIIESKDKGYLFAFVHPRADALIEQNPEKCLSFEIKRGSSEEKLFLTKIDDMFKVVGNLRPGQKFEPNELFGWNNLQYE